ncbi:hypothetical protein Zmor_019773 [Zophobas morio]|uniref:Gustatory receptor n=1 Tax=Zophobas morio TaxID=2755281 RepID=A0AA38I2C3_9CUCU|nr:hypothetical protein Zmor_019773 [Zophobas morio]
MYFKHSIKDINFIRPFNFYLNLLFITPWNNFDKNSKNKPLVAHVYGFCLIVLKILRLIYVATDTIHSFSETMFFSQLFFVLSTNVVLVILTLLTIVKSMFLDSNNWNLLYKHLHFIDKNLHNVGVIETKIWSNFYCKFLIKHTIFIIGLCYILYTWIQLLKVSVFKVFLTYPILELYYDFLVIVLFSTLVEAFKSRYNDLSGTLSQIFASGDERALKTLAQLYRILGDTIDIFNKIFGYQIILIILRCGLMVITVLNNGFLLFVFMDTKYVSYHYIFCNMCILANVVYTLVAVISPIGETVLAAENFIDLCYKLQQELPIGSSKSKSLRKLTTHSERFLKKFTASGHFDINKNIVFNFFGTVMTYFIIAMQFNGTQILKISTREN